MKKRNIGNLQNEVKAEEGQKKRYRELQNEWKRLEKEGEDEEARRKKNTASNYVKVYVGEIEMDRVDLNISDWLIKEFPWYGRMMDETIEDLTQVFIGKNRDDIIVNLIESKCAELIRKLIRRLNSSS